jgi:LacI family transcriptional regulator
VARAAGVSVSTVSRVLNDKDDVAPETYQKVQDVIEELSYTSSLAARSMRSRRTNVIGLIMPDVQGPFAIQVMRGINRAIMEFGYDLIVYTGGDVKKKSSVEREQRYVSLLNSGITDGVIVVTPVATTFSTASPVVVVDPNNVSPDCPAVIAANRSGALVAMEYLISLGHRRIGFIGGRPELQSAVQRLQGYKDGLRQTGIPLDPELIQAGDYTTETGMICAQKLLSLSDPPTAIFAANDQSAIGVVKAAQEAGLRVPDDVSLVGFDNIPEAIYISPGLTTVDQSIDKMGYVATEMLVSLIQGESLDGNLYKMPTHLIIRDSCRPIVRNTPSE